MGHVVIENGIDACSPVACLQQFPPEVIVREHDASIAVGETLTVIWDVINIPSGDEITSNNLLWSANPEDLDNMIAGSGDGPFTASFTVPDEKTVFFQIDVIVDNINYISSIFSVIIQVFLYYT